MLLLRRIARAIKRNHISIAAAVLFPAIALVLLEVDYFNLTRAALPSSTIEQVQAFLSILWLVPLPSAVVSLLGILLYHDTLHDRRPAPLPRGSIYFRLVTRGTNQPTVVATAVGVIETMERFMRTHRIHVPYVVEVVTEKTTPHLSILLAKVPYGERVRVIEVHPAFTTERSARYKARALHFALQESAARPHDWIFHLDDESRIDAGTVQGILRFAAAEERRTLRDPAYKPRIGQGTILYHRTMRENLLYTLADSLRTADDLGRYFLQYLFGVCVFGMHGSFILCRNSVEQAGGFDFYPDQCITEDAYWGLAMMQRGYRFGHVSGYVHEQSPERAIDFVKQRRRWFRGIANVLQANDIRPRYKLMLSGMSLLWSFSWLVILYTIVNILHPIRVPLVVGILASLAFATYILMYLIGYAVNVRYVAISLPRKVAYGVLQVALIPVCALLEAAGVLYGLLDRTLDFHVIRKSVQLVPRGALTSGA